MMLDTDGQRPEAIPELKKFVALTQVTLEGNALDAHDRAGAPHRCTRRPKRECSTRSCCARRADE